MTPEQKTVMHDAAVFAFKMWLDGLKDIAIAFVGLGAALIDIMPGRRPADFKFYRVMRFGERIDDALDLYSTKRLRRNDRSEADEL
ncbi:MAG: hypothetical protein WEE89_08530 [Gemmatimonadota bacterium]